MNRRDLLSLAGASGLNLIRAATPKPNFVFILADDLGWRDLGCYGDPVHETPNLDKLAKDGVRFTQAYAACPVCSPTRASIMTGKYPARYRLTSFIPGRANWPHSPVIQPSFQQQLPSNEVTIAEVLKPLGYRTASIGKWHLGGKGFTPTDQGFDLNIAGNAGGSVRSFFDPPGGEKGEYFSDFLGRQADKFLREVGKDPFFLYLPHYAPHIPLQAPQKTIDKYRAKIDPKSRWNPTYAAMIDNMDQNIGRVLRTLQETGQEQNTVVVFMSDNGGLRFESKAKEAVTDNSPLRAGKGHLYEGGIRVPMIVRWPGVSKAGLVSPVPTCSVDFMSTFSRAVGVTPPPNDGIDLAPVLSNKAKPKRALFWHYPHYANQGNTPGGAIRDGDWKLIEFFEDGRKELFDLKSDLSEKRNLIDKESKRGQKLADQLAAWRKSVDADMPKPNPNFDPAKADQGLTGVEPKTPPVIR
jgi:arylsulfatase A